MSADILELQGRVSRLEAALRRSRWTALIVAAVIATVAVLVARAGSTVSAGTYLLTADGVNRASLTAGEAGTPALAFYDAAGRVRLNLSMRQDGSPDITLSDVDGRIRAALRLSESGIPYIFFTDPAGDIRAALGVPPDGLPSLVLLGDEGTVRYMTP